jgi:broad specificity phosphatase PhoE
MKIYLIRHGETTGDIEDRYGGEYNDSLSEKGKEQVKKLAEKMKSKDIKMVFSSPKKRTLETAEKVSEATGLETIVLENLRERNQYAILSGLTKAEALEQYPEEVQKLEAHTYKTFVSDSENYKKFAERVKDVFDKILSETDENVAIITHGGPIKALFRDYFKFGEFEELGDCAIIEIEKNNEEFKLVSMDEAKLKSEE